MVVINKHVHTSPGCTTEARSKYSMACSYISRFTYHTPNQLREERGGKKIEEEEGGVMTDREEKEILILL